MKILLGAAAMAASFCMAATVGETDRFIPLVLDGGGWTTSITLVNVTRKPAVVSVTFLDRRGLNGTWKLALKASRGKIYDNAAEIPLAPGMSATVATSGADSDVLAGFADVVELQDQLVAGFATLEKREAGAVVERTHVPLVPANERRSVVPVDLTVGETIELSLVTLTTSTVADIVFRNQDGVEVLTDRVPVDDAAHVRFELEDRWPALKGFRGTLEWTISFPNADRYEHRTFGGIALRKAGVRYLGTMQGMTLREDQLSTSPY
jgi:hypothetical protein